MWHDLKKVAESRLLDPASFEAFVQFAHGDKLDDKGMISSWHVDEVVKSYRDHLPPTTAEEQRLRIIQQRMKERQPA